MNSRFAQGRERGKNCMNRTGPLWPGMSGTIDYVKFFYIFMNGNFSPIQGPVALNSMTLSWKDLGKRVF